MRLKIVSASTTVNRFKFYIIDVVHVKNVKEKLVVALIL